MPVSGYLTPAGIESSLYYLAGTYSSICQHIVLPEKSHESRTIRAIKIANGTASDRRGVLFIGGVHAREIVNPDLLLSFAFKICQAYNENTGLTFGGKSYSKELIKLIVDVLDLHILPLVNPDGRAYVQSPTGDPWWRKNRGPNPGLPCKGVDVNRNYDLLWSSGIGTSSSSCSETYKGSSPFSEPETRNVQYLLDTFPNIGYMVDVHSYSELILYPWGDDESQTTTPSMSFTNPAYDGLRGTVGDTLYKEYIPQTDLQSSEQLATRVRDAISAVRGRVYGVFPGVLLYPTSATSNDYAYARHFVDGSKRKVFAYVFETGTEFQPPYSEALNIISEVSAGLTEFCLACLCVVEETVRGTALEAELAAMRKFRDRHLRTTQAGRKYLRLINEHSIELMVLMQQDQQFRKRAVAVLEQLYDVAKSVSDKEPKVFRADVIDSTDKLLSYVGDKGSPALREAIATLQRDLQHFEGRSVLEGLASASDDQVHPMHAV